MATPPNFVKDSRGLPVPAGPYRRVVSLVPSLTDTVCGLGAGERLVGRTIYCCEPRGFIRSVPAFGGTKNPDVAGIIAAGPDLVLVCEEENRREDVAALEEAGVRTFVVMPRSLDDVARLLSDYGVLLDAGAAAGRALSDLTAARLAVGAVRSKRATEPAVAVLIWKKPWMAAGSGHHIAAMLAELGLRNACANRAGYWEISIEDLANRAPDLVLLPDEPYPFTHHDSWSLAAAGVVPSRRRAVLLDGKLLSWYGTRTARSLRELLRLLDARLAEGPGGDQGA